MKMRNNSFLARDLTIVARDRAILTYGALGHVKTLPC